MRKASLILLATATALSCTHKKSSDLRPQLPIVTTSPVTNIVTTSATGGGTVSNDIPATFRGLQWDVDSNFSHPTNIGQDSGTGTFSMQMTPLLDGAHYYYRAWGSNNNGVAYGKTIAFSTITISTEYIISTIAALSDPTDLPTGVAVDPSGAVYACDVRGNIWKIASAATMTLVTTISGKAGGIACDKQGNFLVSATDQKKILHITPGGVTTTFAGGAAGIANGQGAAAGFLSPQTLYLKSDGTLYILDSSYIRTADPSGNVSTPYSPLPASNPLTAIAIDAAGKVYFSDGIAIFWLNDYGQMASFAGQSTPGSTDGPYNSASFSGISGMGIDKDGNVVAADKTLMRRITTTGTSTAGDVRTIAGSTTAGATDGGGDIARFGATAGLVVDAQGVIYVADSGNKKIRKIIRKQ